jgi:hypothetical protein
MLTVYTYRISKPADCFDMSDILLDNLADTLTAIHSHQRKAKIWFGYLDGWMMTPMEEVILRKVLRDFDCIVVSKNPLSFSQSWKNEIDTIYTDSLSRNGTTETDNNGSALRYGS